MKPLFKSSILTLKHTPNIEIYPLEAFMSGRMVVHENDLVISILSPGMEHPKTIRERERTHCVQFADFDLDRLNGEAKLTYGAFCITPHHAHNIIEFVERYLTSGLEEQKGPNRIMIHCEAGISRSPAVGIALATIYGLLPGSAELLRRHIAYNAFVFRTMLDAWRNIMVSRFTEEMKGIF